MLPITDPSQTACNDRNADAQPSSSTQLEVPSAGRKKWKSLTGVFDSKKSSPPLRQTSLAINVCPDFVYL